MLKSMKLVGNIRVKISCIFPLHYNIGNSIFLTVNIVVKCCVRDPPFSGMKTK